MASITPGLSAIRKSSRTGLEEINGDLREANLGTSLWEPGLKRNFWLVRYSLGRARAHPPAVPVHHNDMPTTLVDSGLELATWADSREYRNRADGACGDRAIFSKGAGVIDDDLLATGRRLVPTSVDRMVCREGVTQGIN